MESIKTIKEYISNNKDKLNLSFNGTIIKEDSNLPSRSKVKFLEKINNKSYHDIIPFYKKITRFV
jgi:hypothetical protein